MAHIIKRRGHRQEFDEKKVYASVYSACLVVGETHEQAELTADEITKEIKAWIKDKDEVDVYRVTVRVATELERLNPDAALMYKSHRDIS